VTTLVKEARVVNGWSRYLAGFALVAVLAVSAATLGASSAKAQTSCGILTASGRAWIIVAKGVPCATAKNVTRSFASATAALHAGARRTVTTPLLHGFVCVLASEGKPGGSCSTAGAARSVLWLVAG
jgi:hypothetical protein